MVNPILIIGITLGSAFLIGIVQAFRPRWTGWIFYPTLVFDFLASAVNLYGFLSGSIGKPIMVKIGGFPPPVGINLLVGKAEAALGTLIFAVALLGAYHWGRRGFPQPQGKIMVLFLLLALGAAGISFTGDFFNLFVFVEITSIASYGLVASSRREEALEAAFKYMVVGSISSTFILLGVVFLYKATGSLNMLDIGGKIAGGFSSQVLGLISLLILAGLLVELEVFPINGWALDIYQGADPVVVALLAGAAVKAFYLVYLKTASYLALPSFFKLSLIFGGGTYLVSQFFAWRQENARRLLGYSSVGQLGLLILAGGLLLSPSLPASSRAMVLAAVVLLILNHSFSKSSLFLLADNVKGEKLEDWKGVLSSSPVFRFSFTTSVFSVAGLPPFPGFWAKLLLVMAAARFSPWLVALILAGALAEVVYYFRFFYLVSLGDKKAEVGNNLLAPLVASLFLVGAVPLAYKMAADKLSLTLPGGVLVLLGLSLLVYLLGFSRLLQWLASLGLVAYGAYLLLPFLKADLSGFFLGLILAGAAVLLLATYPGAKNLSSSFYPAYLVVVFSMAGLVLSTTWFSLFVFWEIMSWASFLLINMGRGKKAAWIYAVLSAAGAYAMLGGISLLPSPYISSVKSPGPWLALLLSLGFLVKMATVPLHIWARDAYGESPDDFTPLLSGIMSKMGVFGSALVFLYVVINLSSRSSFNYLLGWAGVLTAFFMTLLAVFQEDLKKLLAYSSVAQVGYILLGLALFTPLGWTAALYHTVNHFFFKGLLFVAAAGIVYRVGTSYLPHMGGLIRRMPLTFFASLLAVIALAGVPPLSGFAGKWLLYTALIEKGWIFIAVVAFLASTLAFLYSFKILHAVFLGQLQEENCEVREVPIPVAVVEIILLIPLVVLGAFPRLILDPITRVLGKVTALGIPDLKYTKTLGVVSRLGHWNALFLMVFFAGAFILALIFFALTSARVKLVGQMDVGYSGEVPRSPEDLHFGYGMYDHFRRAVKWLIYPLATRVWRGIYEALGAVAEMGRRIYTGDTNTYAAYVIGISLLILLIFKG